MATVADGTVVGLTVTGTSSLVIVPIPVPVAIVAFTGALSTTENVSFASGTMSPLTTT